MAVHLPLATRVTRSVEEDAPTGRHRRAQPRLENNKREQQPEPADLQVFGCVDTFTPPNLLRGWALQEGRSDPLNIEVLMDGRPIGVGQSGEMRPKPTENCGFTVAVSEPITMSQIRSHSISVRAITNHGYAYQLPIWQNPLLRVFGVVDSFHPPDVLGGWVRYENDDSPAGPLDLKVLLDDRVIGTGQSGQNGSQRRFSITLFEPITAEFICSRALRVYAIDCAGETHELQIWAQLQQQLSAESNVEDWSAQLAEVRKFVRRKLVATHKPYRTDGIILPPTCNASELRPVIEQVGLSGFVRHLSVPKVLALLDRDKLPIPQAANRENYYGGRDADYWLSGLDDYFKVKTCWEKYLPSVKRILDFGGSTGRVFRHFYCQSEIAEVHACDSKKVNVEWCKKYLPPDIRVFLNSFYPGLPFPDGCFEVITAFSVFTHIDEFEDGWLLELSRILKPKGIAYLTIADEDAWAAMPQHLITTLRSSPSATGIDLHGPMPCDRMVFPAGDHAPFGINVFHRQDYIRRFWSRYFHVEEVIPQGHHFQTVVVLRNQQRRRRRRAA